MLPILSGAEPQQPGAAVGRTCQLRTAFPSGPRGNRAVGPFVSSGGPGCLRRYFPGLLGLGSP